MTGASPRLLYLAYAFPPSPAIGSVRSWNTAKWLGALGWSVSVVTPERTLLGGACRVVARRFGVDPTAGWAASAERACAGLKEGDVDLILATASPIASFRAARRLGRRLRCPFVMDYRDPWTGNPHAANGLKRPDCAREEAELIRECAVATVVSPSWARLIGGTFGVPEKMRVISNGFDPDMFADLKPERFGHFSLVYAGTLYPPKRVLDPVLRALRAFAQRRPAAAARLHYFGDYGGPVREAAARLGASSYVVLHGRVSRRAALQAQKGADLLVVVASVEEYGALPDRGIVTGKVFDCMALERPALVVAPRGSDLYAIAQTAGGMRCFTGSDVDGMARYIGDVAGGDAPPALDRRVYRWDAIGRELDGVLRSVVARARSES